MVHYKPVKITIDALSLAEGIINVVIWHHGLSDSFVTNTGSLFALKFWLLVCYFLGIKCRLFTAFYPHTDGHTKRQNSIIETYLKTCVNFKQNDWARFLPIAKFAYNNAKNASTGHTSFELNYGYHPCVSYKENIDSYSKSKLADKLLADLQELMTVCRKSLHHTQKLQKQAHNKGVEPKSYAPNNKVWLNSKYIKTK